jgi:1,4-alpha-glucan branching enzyme
MRTGTMVPYAVRRTRSHLQRLNRLYEDIKAGKIDREWLTQVEQMDNIFPHINYRVYRPLA